MSLPSSAQPGSEVPVALLCIRRRWVSLLVSRRGAAGMRWHGVIGRYDSWRSMGKLPLNVEKSMLNCRLGNIAEQPERSHKRHVTYHGLPFPNCKDQSFNAKHQRLSAKSSASQEPRVFSRRGQLIGGAAGGFWAGSDRATFFRGRFRGCPQKGANQTVWMGPPGFRDRLSGQGLVSRDGSLNARREFRVCVRRVSPSSAILYYY